MKALTPLGLLLLIVGLLLLVLIPMVSPACGALLRSF